MQIKYIYILISITLMDHVTLKIEKNYL